ncbi:hypothetical protein GCM10009789_38120 [Kribbella sancticallisti]|uniref:Uncharacterized protein n=1 Tax=Kribbella sancticallisti TaxID=460087 RepID=A0ABN2DNA0_9ACTN
MFVVVEARMPTEFPADLIRAPASGRRDLFDTDGLSGGEQPVEVREQVRDSELETDQGSEVVCVVGEHVDRVLLGSRWTFDSSVDSVPGSRVNP